MLDANSTNEQGEQGEQWISVREAAEKLHIGIRGVQQRIARGKIRHKKEGERLLVCLERAPLADSPQGEQDEQRERTGANNEQLREQDANNANTALFAQLRSENAFLRSELTATREAATIAQAEMRRLLLADRQEIAQLRQQLALDVAPDPVQEAPADTADASTVEPAAFSAVVQATPQTDTQEAIRDTEPDVSAGTEQQRELKPEGVQKETEAAGARKWWEFWKRE